MRDGAGFAVRAGAAKWLWLTALVVALDQYTKRLVVEHFALYQGVTLNPMLQLMRLHNTGAAFSFLSTAGGWQRWAFVALGLIVSAAILVWLLRLPARGRGLLAASLALVMGGALGNVVDRILAGYVVDFIRVHYQDWYFPAFNVADSAITIGAGLLILDNVLDYCRKPKR